MDIIIIILKAYLIFFICLIIIYMVRHYFFSISRVLGKQKIDYHEILDSDLPQISVIVPMHNEEKVARNVLEAIINSTYPKDKFELIVVNDHSEDNTKFIIEEYSQVYSYIRILNREGDEEKGKSQSLNDAILTANGEIIVVYDADYIPTKGQIRDLVINFKDPQVGAVMGRVIPINCGKNLLTRISDLERSSGYQIDQQARYNLDLIPQFGGTVGAFRKCIIKTIGGFDHNVLAEDTEFTFRLFINGYKVIYANQAECYEEVPETWDARGKQLKRWSTGHNQVMFKYLFKLLISKKLTVRQKIDGTLLLIVYVIPFLTLLGFIDSFTLFFLGQVNFFGWSLMLITIFFYNTFGNFAPYFQIGLSGFLDGAQERLRLTVFFYFVFVFNIFYVSLGFIDALFYKISGKKIRWNKTERFRSI